MNDKTVLQCVHLHADGCINLFASTQFRFRNAKSREVSKLPQVIKLMVQTHVIIVSRVLQLDRVVSGINRRPCDD